MADGDIKCKIIHGDQAGQIVMLNRPAAEAGQSFGTHRIMDPDERPPELPANSEVQARTYAEGDMPENVKAMDAAQTKEFAGDITGEKFTSKTDAQKTLQGHFAGKPTGDMSTDGGAVDAGVAQKRRDEDPRMQGTPFAVAPDTARPLMRHSQAGKEAKADARKAQPTMSEQAKAPATAKVDPKATPGRGWKK